VQYLDLYGNYLDTSFLCAPVGLPRIGAPARIVQLAGEVILMYNARNTWRVVPTDGRPHHPVNSKDQTYMGDSVGRWEGDTLVVEAIGFNDDTWIGWAGWFHSTDMRVAERFQNVCKKPPTEDKTNDNLGMNGALAFHTLLFEGDRIDAAAPADAGPRRGRGDCLRGHCRRGQRPR